MIKPSSGHRNYDRRKTRDRLSQVVVEPQSLQREDVEVGGWVD